MARKMYREDGDQLLEVVFEPRSQFDWVVQEDPQLQDELNKILNSGEEISTKVVNKVLDRIKEL
jgi:hypothetical protein